MDEKDRIPSAESNEWCAEEKEETYPLSSWRESPVFKAAALLVVIIFTVLALGSFLEVLTLPSPDFLVESHRLSKDPFVQELRQAVVCITAIPGEKADLFFRQQKGTGFNISAEGLIVTNRHLVEDAGALHVSFYEQGSCEVSGWSTDPTADLALITLESRELPFVDLVEGPLPAVGEQVIIIGNPLSYYGVAMRGEITGYWQLDEFSGPVMGIDAPIHKGSSGSPVFNAEGKVVAVVFAAVEGKGEGDTRGLALPVALLENFSPVRDQVFHK